MYLYRNFGQLLEAYIEKNSSIDDSEDTDSGGQDSLLGERVADRPGVLLKSESEDSGVEEPVFTPQGSEQNFSLDKDPDLAEGPLSPSPSPALTPSLLSSTKLKGREGWHRVRTHVELALQRSKQRGSGSQCRVPRLPVSLTIIQAPLGQSLDEGPLRLVDAEPCQQSQGRSEVDSQVCDEKADPGIQLSPGLSYLDEVCKLLEEIARLQARNQELKRERDGLQYLLRDKDRQELMSGQCLWGAAEPETASEGAAQRRWGPMSSGLAPTEQLLLPAFRRRSMSESEALKSNVERWKETQVHGSMRQLTEVDSSKQTKGRQDRVNWQATSLKETSREFQDPREPNKEPDSKHKLKKMQHSLFKRKSKNKSVK